MPNTPNPVKAMKAQLREVKREMREKGIKRKSCFNGGHSAESYRLNAECFRLKTEIDLLTK